MDILGISCFFHDAAAALIRNGEIIAAAEEERFTRKKHDYDFPVSAIEFCLNMGKIRSEDLDYVFLSKSHSRSSNACCLLPCKPKYVDKGWKLINQDSDGSFSLNMEYFTFHHSTENTYGPKFVDMFGPERDAKSYFFTPDSGYPSYFGDKPANYTSLANQNKHYADIAASIQRVTEEVLIKMVNHLHKETGLSRLCMAGGVALNSVANGRILRETAFEEIYVQPAAGDGGVPLGRPVRLPLGVQQTTQRSNETRLLGKRL